MEKKGANFFYNFWWKHFRFCKYAHFSKLRSRLTQTHMLVFMWSIRHFYPILPETGRTLRQNLVPTIKFHDNPIRRTPAVSCVKRPRHGSGGQSPASQPGGPRSNLDQTTWAVGFVVDSSTGQVYPEYFGGCSSSYVSGLKMVLWGRNMLPN